MDIKPKYRAALEYLRVHGWTQHTIQGINGSVCINGALYYTLTEAERDEVNRISPEPPYYFDADSLLLEIIREQYPNFNGESIFRFNDNCYFGTAVTQDDIERVLEKAAIKAEELAFIEGKGE